MAAVQPKSFSGVELPDNSSKLRLIVRASWPQEIEPVRSCPKEVYMTATCSTRAPVRNTRLQVLCSRLLETGEYTILRHCTEVLPWTMLREQAGRRH